MTDRPRLRPAPRRVALVCAAAMVTLLAGPVGPAHAVDVAAVQSPDPEPTEPPAEEPAAEPAEPAPAETAEPAPEPASVPAPVWVGAILLLVFAVAWATRQTTKDPDYDDGMP